MLRDKFFSNKGNKRTWLTISAGPQAFYEDAEFRSDSNLRDFVLLSEVASCHGPLVLGFAQFLCYTPSWRRSWKIPVSDETMVLYDVPLLAFLIILLPGFHLYIY